MKFYQKYQVTVNDYTFDYAQNDIGNLLEALDGDAAIWKSHDDSCYYTLHPEVVVIYDDLEDALVSLCELYVLLD